MMKPYALHSLVTAIMHIQAGISSIEFENNVVGQIGIGVNRQQLVNNLMSLAQAHEAKDIAGPYGPYVWGCEAAVNRAPRRYARTMSILRAFGVQVPDVEYASLF